MDRGRGGMASGPWRCQVFGDRLRFRTESVMMVWECERGCGVTGSKTYPTAQAARRYAEAFDRRDAHDLGRRAPLIGLFPLRWWHWFRGR